MSNLAFRSRGTPGAVVGPDFDQSLMLRQYCPSRISLTASWNSRTLLAGRPNIQVSGEWEPSGAFIDEVNTGVK
eukprot:2563944-Amphidinium_carterae.1